MAAEELTFSLGRDGDVTLKNWDGLYKWIEKERAYWEWLARGDANTDAHSVAGTVQSNWDQVLNQLRSVQAKGHPVSGAAPYLQPFSGGPLLVHDQPDGVLILDIRATAGDTSAAFAYGFLRGMVNLSQVRNRDDLLGAILTTIPDSRKPSELSERLQRERSNYRNSIKNAIARIDSAADEREEAFAQTLNRGKALVSRMMRRRRDSWKQHQVAWQKAADSAVESIKAVENAYLEAMRLRAPVTYWQDKAADHKNREGWAVVRLSIFFPVALCGLGYTFWKSADYLLDHATYPQNSAPVALYVIITAGLVALSTLLFWIGRLLTKLYLSEHHLKNDADERAIMTKTYLALTKESAAADADRSIILNALFRNTPDGIVKDDGPSDLSLQALVSRLATR